MELYFCISQPMDASVRQNILKTVSFFSRASEIFNHVVHFTTKFKIKLFLLVGYDLGGVITNSKREQDHSNKKGIHCKDMHW